VNGKAGRVGKDPEAALKLLEDLRLIRRWKEECWVESQKKPGLKVKKKCKFNEITELGRIVYKILVKFEELDLI